MSNDPLITMKVEVLELQAIVNFITGVQLDELTCEELEILSNTLRFQNVNVQREIDKRKAAQDGNPGQHINKLF